MQAPTPTLGKPRTLQPLISRPLALRTQRPFKRGLQAGAACAQASQQQREGLARAPARLLAGLAAGGLLVRPPAAPAEEAAGAAQPAAEQLGAASDAVLAAATAQAANGFSDSDNLIISVGPALHAASHAQLHASGCATMSRRHYVENGTAALPGAEPRLRSAARAAPLPAPLEPSMPPHPPAGAVHRRHRGADRAHAGGAQQPPARLPVTTYITLPPGLSRVPLLVAAACGEPCAAASHALACRTPPEREPITCEPVSWHPQVAYLSFGSWQDSRAEAEDRKRAGGLAPVARWVGRHACTPHVPSLSTACSWTPHACSGLGVAAPPLRQPAAPLSAAASKAHVAAHCQTPCAHCAARLLCSGSGGQSAKNAKKQPEEAASFKGFGKKK